VRGRVCLINFDNFSLRSLRERIYQENNERRRKIILINFSFFFLNNNNNNNNLFIYKAHFPNAHPLKKIPKHTTYTVK
jgi:hypothetical protein